MDPEFFFLPASAGSRLPPALAGGGEQSIPSSFSAASAGFAKGFTHVHHVSMRFICTSTGMQAHQPLLTPADRCHELLRGRPEDKGCTSTHRGTETHIHLAVNIEPSSASATGRELKGALPLMSISGALQALECSAAMECQLRQDELPWVLRYLPIRSASRSGGSDRLERTSLMKGEPSVEKPAKPAERGRMGLLHQLKQVQTGAG